MVEKWLRTDEAEDVAASVRHALRCWSALKDDEQIWKWIALALHSSLQGACVCHLVTTFSPIGAVSRENAAEWMEYWRARDADPLAHPPKTYLLNLPGLIRLVRRNDTIGSGQSGVEGIKITKSELKWILKFHNTIRNQFVHFEPQGWAIELSGMPDIAKLVSRLITEILDAGWAFRHKNDDWKTALRASLNDLAKLEL